MTGQTVFSNPAPGPGLLELLRSLTELRDNPLTFLQQAAATYGELVHFKLGPWNAFVLTRPEDIQHVLQENNRNYTKDTIQYNALADVTGRGLLTSDGEPWLRQRRRMQPAFHRQRVQGFGPLMLEAAAGKAADWEAAAQSGALIDVDREMMELALEILGKALLGVDLRTEAPALTSAVLVALDHIVNGIKSPNILPGFLPTPSRRAFQRALRTLDGAVQEILQARRKAGPSHASGDLLDMMLHATDDGAAMTDQQLRDELITILIAGHETVASALTWACYLLATNPTVEARLHVELDAVLGGRAPTMDDLPALDFTRRVFDETLRLYPPAWLVTRKNVEPDVIGGARIPAGSLVIVSLATTHRNPAYWPDPDRFDPDRFLPEVASARPRYAYLPFGGGPRLCIGNHFALLEAPLILASLYQRYHLALDPGREVIVDPLVTLRPRGGLPMRVRAYAPKSS
jgi:cytochrome P450